MAASAVSAAMALRVSSGRPVAFIRNIPWTAASSELRTHFAQFGHIRKCTVPFDRETGFHRGIGWVQFSSQEELQNALQQESHIIDGVKLQVRSQRPKVCKRIKHLIKSKISEMSNYPLTENFSKCFHLNIENDHATLLETKRKIHVVKQFQCQQYLTKVLGQLYS